MQDRRRSGAALFCLLAALVVPPAAAQVFDTEHHRVRVETVTGGLEHPWALAFLPDGRMLVTERPGRLRIIAGGVLDPIPVAGLPEVRDRGQGGLLDVALHPRFAENAWVYLTYAMPGKGGGRTALGRGRLVGHALEAFEVLFVAENAARGGVHYGSRIVFGPGGRIYMTVGERGRSEEAQSRASHNGTVLRLNEDGSVPEDNPFVGDPSGLPEIYSYGHRNPQGLAVRPSNGQVWLTEHGPAGGDEVNQVRAGVNYGWPVITHGQGYWGGKIGEGSAKEGMAQPVLHWTPSIAPSGAAFYAGRLFPGWQGNLFAGALKFQYVARLEIEGDRILREEPLFRDGSLGRIRDVRAGPDGALYLLTDAAQGRLLRVVPDR